MHGIRRRNRQSVLVVSRFSLSCTSHSCWDYCLLGLDGVTAATVLLCVHPPPPATIHSSAGRENNSKKTSHLVESVTRRSKRIAHITANLGSSRLALIAAVRRIVGLLIIFRILPSPGHHSNEALPINHCVLLRGDKPMRMCLVASNEPD